jgi:hypothetical protein
LISSWWLDSIEGPYARSLERNLVENPDPVYGEGFRRARSQTQDQSLGQIIERLRRTGSLR